MELTGRIARQILLLSLLVITIPMVVFPERFGTDLAKASLIYAVYELAFYGLVTVVVTRRTLLIPIIQSAGVCFIYRLVLGAFFGLLVAAVYSINVKAAVTMGLSSYLPAVVLHVLATPFILWPALGRLSAGPVASRAAHEPASGRLRETGGASIAISREHGYRPAMTAATDESGAKAATTRPRGSEAAVSLPMSDINGFDRATRYIGEHVTVLVVAVVDADGLLLSNFQRGNLNGEDWAPFALVFRESNARILDRLNWDHPEKLELLLKDKRLVVACESGFNLMVIAERQVDDVLNIRINQGLEIIRKYAAERYSQKLIANAERSYVSSTK